MLNMKVDAFLYFSYPAKSAYPATYLKIAERLGRFNEDVLYIKTHPKQKQLFKSFCKDIDDEYV